jgi:hypothetical protein
MSFNIGFNMNEPVRDSIIINNKLNTNEVKRVEKIKES